MNKKGKSRGGGGGGGGGGERGPSSRGSMSSSGGRGHHAKDAPGIRNANRPMSNSPSRGGASAVAASNYGDVDTEPSASADGILANKRLVYACTCLIGASVHVLTTESTTWEGIFRVFSSQLEVTL